MAVQLATRRFTVDDYYRMLEAGILTEDDRVELIEGEIVEMAPIGSPHAGSVNSLNELLGQAIRGRALVSVQNPLRLGPHSELVPDLMLLRPRPDRYRSGHPGPEDVLLLIEVADTTLAYDQGVKVPLYARSGVPEVWVVDLQGRQIQVCRQPWAEGYRDVRAVLPGQLLSPQAFPDVVLAAGEILL